MPSCSVPTRSECASAAIPVAAVLVNYFGAADIARAALSVLDDAPGTEVIVVDNSADAAEHALLRALLPAGARVLDAGANLGFGRACNLGFAATAAPFVFFVNPDVHLVGPGCIGALVQALQADGGLAAAGPQQYLDSRCQWRISPALLPTAVRAWVHEQVLRDMRGWQRLAGAARAEHLRLWTARAPMPQRALSGGALMLRRAALGAHEAPFDTDFFMYYEDSDLCLRLRRAGWRLAVVPAARAIHAWRNEPHKHPLMQGGARVYYARHWPGTNPGARWLERAGALAGQPATAPHKALAPRRGAVEVPPQWQQGWLLELSPSPLLQPAVGLLAAGACARVPAQVLDRLGPGPLHGRLSGLPLQGREDAAPLLLCWEDAGDRQEPTASIPRPGEHGKQGFFGINP